jgi:hypothetical protein
MLALPCCRVAPMEEGPHPQARPVACHHQEVTKSHARRIAAVAAGTIGLIICRDIPAVKSCRGSDGAETVSLISKRSCDRAPARQIQQHTASKCAALLTAAGHSSANTLGFEIAAHAVQYGSTCRLLVGPYLTPSFGKGQPTRPRRRLLHHAKGVVHATANTPRRPSGQSCTGPKQ